MSIIRWRKSYFSPEDFEVFCGEEMKPYVALSGEGETQPIAGGEQREMPEVYRTPGKNLPFNPPSKKMEEKRPVWNRISNLFRTES